MTIDTAAPQRRLIIVTGSEGAGKSTTVRALLPYTPDGARLDAEDVGQVNPCRYDEPFFGLLRRNVAALVRNFWDAGYRNVISGVYIVELLVAKEVRDRRRVTRAKQTTPEWRDHVDLVDPGDLTIRQAIADYRYLGIDTTHLDVAETVQRIRDALPEIYAGAS